MPATLIRICAWSGPAAMAIVAPIFWMMGFLPPPPAALDAAQVAAFYEAHRPENRRHDRHRGRPAPRADPDQGGG
ncbi:MAG: hypothetical protein AAGM38_17485, partial [Pseudomonadota bacterium]